MNNTQEKLKRSLIRKQIQGPKSADELRKIRQLPTILGKKKLERENRMKLKNHQKEAAKLWRKIQIFFKDRNIVKCREHATKLVRKLKEIQACGVKRNLNETYSNP